MITGLGEKLHGYEEMGDFVQSLEKPRCAAVPQRNGALLLPAYGSNLDCGLSPFNQRSRVEECKRSCLTSRRVIMLVMAGKPVDATIDLLMEHLEAGDCIIDGGNEW